MSGQRAGERVERRRDDDADERRGADVECGARTTSSRRRRGRNGSVTARRTGGTRWAERDGDGGAGAHYHFAGWTGDVRADTINAAMTVTMDQARTVAANFELDTQTLEVMTRSTASPAAGSHVYDYFMRTSGQPQEMIGGTDSV